MIKDYAAENSRLLSQAALGDEEARKELIMENMGLVHSIVRRFLGRGYEEEDLFQVGCIGLVRAVQKFDTSFNVQFSTYAVPMIIGEIKRFVRDDGIIKVSRSLKETAAKAVYIKEKLLKERGEEPSVAEIADMLGICAQELAAAINSQRPPSSLYATIDDDNGRTIMDTIESKRDEMGDAFNKILLEELMDGLSERDRKIVYMRYYKQKTQSEVAQRLGISQVQVSRIEKRILKTMRDEIAQE